MGGPVTAPTRWEKRGSQGRGIPRTGGTRAGGGPRVWGTSRTGGLRMGGPRAWEGPRAGGSPGARTEGITRGNGAGGDGFLTVIKSRMNWGGVFYQPRLKNKLRGGGHSLMNWEGGLLEGPQPFRRYQQQKPPWDPQEEEPGGGAGLGCTDRFLGGVLGGLAPSRHSPGEGGPAGP